MIKCKYEGTGIWNGRCTGTKEVDPCPGYDKCKEYKPDYKTNADRIRAMSDEELAVLLADEIPHGYCYDCDLDCSTSEGDKFEDSCPNAFYKWLQQPPKGE